MGIFDMSSLTVTVVLCRESSGAETSFNNVTLERHGMWSNSERGDDMEKNAH